MQLSAEQKAAAGAARSSHAVTHMGKRAYLSETGNNVLRREAEKEKGLLEKRVQRLEEARATEGAALSAELAAQREAVAGELSAKDNKINDLVEELGATQALLTDKEAALQEVRKKLLVAPPLLFPMHLAPCEPPRRLSSWAATPCKQACLNLHVRD